MTLYNAAGNGTTYSPTLEVLIILWRCASNLGRTRPKQGKGKGEWEGKYFPCTSSIRTVTILSLSNEKIYLYIFYSIQTKNIVKKNSD